MRVNFDLALNAWLTEIEIDAESYEAAKTELLKMSLSELLEVGHEKDFSLSDITGEIVEKTLKVRAYNIEYALEEDDFESPEEYQKVLNSLPDNLVLEVLINKDDFEEVAIADEITYKTDQLVNDFNYIIINEY